MCLHVAGLLTTANWQLTLELLENIAGNILFTGFRIWIDESVIGSGLPLSFVSETSKAQLPTLREIFSYCCSMNSRWIYWMFFILFPTDSLASFRKSDL